MKKSIKILSVVLTLALLCGALVISVFAANANVTDITGVSQGAILDFEDVPESAFVDVENESFGSYSDGNSSSQIDGTKTGQGSYPNIVWKGTSSAALDNSVYSDENKYLLLTGTTTAGTSSYIDLYLAAKPSSSNGVVNLPLKAGTNAKYVILDIDMMLPVAGTAPKNWSIQFLRRTVAPGATSSSFISTQSAFNIQATGKINSYTSTGSWANNGCVTLGTDWTHLTVVLQNDICTTDGGVNYIKTTQYIYSNGVLVGTTVIFDNSAASTSAYWDNDLTNVSFCDVRLNMGACDTAAQLAIDNMDIRIISDQYTGNLQTVLDNGTDITNADVNVYDPENMPFGDLAATNTTQSLNYDSFNKAVAAANDYDEITLQADLTKDVTLDKNLYIYPGTYSVGNYLKVADGWQTQYEEAEARWVVSKVANPATINWGACTCGLASCDATHPGNTTSSLGLNANIYEAYEQAVENGYDWSVTVGNTYYYLAGWRNASTSEELATDAVVTEAMLGNTYNYNPIIGTKAVAYSYTNTSGQAATALEDSLLATIIADAQAGSTITLLADVEIPDTAAITVSKNLTIDLNGHVLSDVKAPAAKYATFSYSANLTFVGDVEGSMIVKTHQVNATGNYAGTFAAPGNASATLNLEGENLVAFISCLVGTWNGTANVNIDGGFYAKGNASDNGGWIYANASGTYNVSLKNATFYDIHGVNTPTSNTKTHTFTADNCIFIGTQSSLTTVPSGLTNATITNCYIASGVNVGVTSAGGIVSFGDGNWISSGADIDLVSYATNVKLYDLTDSITIPVHKITFSTTDGAVSYAITTTDTTYTFDKYTGDSTKTATINWGACTCGLDSCDGTHPGNTMSSLELGANIYDAYEQAVANGYAWNVTVNGVYYALVGWKNSATGEVLEADAVVTPEMLDATTTYTPIIESGVPVYSYTDTSGATVIVFEADGKTLAEIVADAQAGSTITLLADVAIPDTATITVSKALTIDLNGHVLSDLKAPAAKYATFTYSANLTFVGDVEGSMIVKTHYVGDKYTGPFTAIESSSATLTMTGENLSVFVPCLVGSWGNTINLVIDGGYYAIGNSSDNGGFMYANANTVTNVSLKNAVFGDIHGFDIYYTNTKTHTFTADNCVFLNYGINTYVPGYTDATITNCYIVSTAKFKYEASWKNNNQADYGGTVYLGEGNWISSSAEISLLDYATNIKAYDLTNSITIPVHKITFSTTDGVVGYSINTTETTYVFDMYTADSTKTATINWGACNCGLGSCDGTHPGNTTSSLELGTNIYSAYEQAVANGYAWNVTVNGVYYALVGWKNSATGEVLEADAVVTPEMLDATTTYTPIIESGVPVYSYTDTSGATVIVFEADGKTLAEIVADAQAGSTITLLADVEIPDTASITINKILTIDLNGHVLSDVKSLAAKYATFEVKADFTIVGEAAGSKVVKAHWAPNSQGVYGYYGLLMQASASNITVTLRGENLVCVAPTVVGAWGLSYNIVIDGGYYTSGNGGDNGGIFHANATSSWNINASNAVFNGSNMFTSANTTKTHTFIADNCVFMGRAFNTMPTLSADSVVTNSYICDGANLSNGTGVLLLGEGNKVSATANLGSIVANADGIVNLYSVSSETFDTYTAAFSTTDGVVSYTLTPGTTTSSFTYVTGTTAGAVFQFTSNSVVYYADSTLDLAGAIAAADAGTTLYVLDTLEIYTPEATYDSETEKYVDPSYYANIDKALTIDLGGNTVYYSQSTKTGSCIQISTSASVVITNGTFVWNVNESYKTTYSNTNDLTNRSFALFNINAANANVTFTDVNTYGSVLAYCYGKSATGTTVTINGGEHHIGLATDLESGLVDMRSNATVNVTEAVIYVDGASLVVFRHYNENGSTKASSATFTDCTILASSVSTNLLYHLNSYTTVAINNCKVFGSLDPSNASSSDSASGDPVSGSVVLGNGTYLSADATINTDIVVAENDRAIVEANKTFTYTLAISTGSIYDTENPTFSISGVNKSYTFTLVVGEPPLETFTITWYKEDGSTVILTVKVLEGTVGITAPTYTPGDSNGWYKTGFDGWTTTYGSTSKVDLTTYTVTDNASFYPAQKADSTPTAYLSGAQYNLTLTGNITVNFFLPTIPDGVTLIGVYDADGNELTGKGIINENGVYYRMYIASTVGATELTTSTKLKVVFTVKHNGEDIELTQNITLSPIKYAQSILADSDKDEPTYTAATHTLIADMIRYSNTLSSTVTDSTISELDTILETYGTLCSELPSDNDFAAYLSTSYGLSGYMESIAFEVSSYQPRWVFNFTSAMKVTDVTVTLDGYYELPDENGYNFGSLTYNIDTEASTYSGNYITTAYMQGIPMYNIDKTITITVTTEDGVVKSGEYNLNTYFAHMNATGDTLKNTQAFLKAFRAFGISSAGYRYANGPIVADAPAKDFFECEHTAANNSTWTASNGRYCSDCERYVFFYSDYVTNSGYGGTLYTDRDTAVADMGNSFTSIWYCHNRANAKYQAGYAVGCVAGDYVYYLGDPLTTSGTVDEISILTDTDWEGAYIISDDSPYDVTDDAFRRTLFCVRGPSVTAPNGTSYSNSGTNISSTLTSGLANGTVVLSPETTNIGWSSGMPMMIQLIDYSQLRYGRQGANASSAYQEEVIIIDEYGNVSKTTPIEWDYVYNTSYTNKDTSATVSSSSFSATAYPITAAPIKISGLDNDGNIACTFENIANNSVTATSYVTCSRGIQVRAANVTVEGMKHILTEDDTNTTPRQAYNTFNTYIAHNTVFKDLLVDQHLGHYIKDSDNVTDKVYNGGKNSIGSYEFGGRASNNTSWINCVTNEFFAEDGSVVYRGLFGTNLMRNSYLKNCVLNSWDAHSGAYNVTIEDCTFEHMNFIGQGDIIIKNTVVYPTAGGPGALLLRADYGSRWEGNVYIDGLELRHHTSYSNKYIDLVYATYQNADFLYGDKTSTSGNYLPFNIYANNVSIKQFTRTTPDFTVSEPGKIDESTMEASTKFLGIYSYYDNTLRTQSYDASSDANQQTPTTAIYFTNCGTYVDSLADLCTPRHSYFSGMKIYIDGVDQSAWYSTCNGAHTDKNGDYYCDTCLTGINCSTSHDGNSDGYCSSCGSTISSCITGDTLITMADGTQKRMDEISPDELVLVYDHYTGEFVAAPIVVYENDGVDDWEVITLTFSDGRQTKLIYEHGYFNKTLNKYVYITEDNYTDYVGDEFAVVSANGEIEYVTLVSSELSVQYVGCYSMATAYNYSFITDGILSMPGGIEGIFNIFEYADNLAYDSEQMAADIAEYGLYTYEDFADYVTEEVFEIFNAKYFKVAVGKGMITFEEILYLIERYA